MDVADMTLGARTPAGKCAHCGADTYLGSLIVGPGRLGAQPVYCATEGCVAAAFSAGTRTTAPSSPAMTVASMRAAVQALEAMLPAPPREIKLHPDDYRELREACKPMLAYPASGSQDAFSGMRIVVDKDAPRLPRKAST